MNKENLHQLHQDVYDQMKNLLPYRDFELWYNKMLILASIPQEDWVKPSTAELLANTV